ncbi:serine carboxypeptidase-like 18 [Ipomoea triloba]|uniref:serine carboxypeptidase-like 18 n=1 Tax=Ipomoea triloba TaxID=35885 RepID=UPI00125DFA09|nr:serine carboxypeptidase-like 18 [Ipomoea triloba]
MSKIRLVFFVVVVLLSSHNHAVEAARGLPVEFLPGFDGPLPFQLQTGYNIGVGQNEEIQLFYYFIKSDSNPQEDPLILWITGGMSCSVLDAIFQQIGPLFIEPVEYNGSLPRLLPFPYSWTKVASFIFLDFPAGVGFSYATTAESLQSNDLLVSSNAYEFLQKWLIDHPEFLSNPFYVGGHSSAGIKVPIVAEMISNGIESGIKPLIQLQGYILGSPRAFETQENYMVPYAYGMGLITDQLYESLKENCKGDYINVDPTNLQCQQDLRIFNKPACLSSSDTTMSSHIMLPGQKSLYHDLYTKLKIDPFLVSGFQCRDEWTNLIAYWVNDYDVQMALHVRQGTNEKWQQCTQSLPYITNVDNTIAYHLNLRGGDHELVCPYLSSEAWIKSLNYSIIDNWRSWMVEGQVAGYTMTYANKMTFATVKGGGHVAPDYRPFESQVMFERWIFYENL